MEKFRDDIATLVDRLCIGEGELVGRGLGRLRERLVGLYGRNMVKVNHSAMELVCAKELILRGYEVDVEHQVGELLVCDVFGAKGDGSIIVEIETGFVPPEHALDPGTYYRARTASKIARYSPRSDKFAFGTPPSNILLVHPVFLKPPRYRTAEEVNEVKSLCDHYYRNPPVTLEDIRNARIHAIHLIDVDAGRVGEVDPDLYIASLSQTPILG